MQEAGGGVPGVGIVRAVAALVPWGERSAWRREWEAELVFSARRMAERSGGAVPPAAALRLRLRALACVADALWLCKDRTMTGIWNELRYAVRGLLRNPGFTVVAVLTLALGIGANTAVFTLVDGVVLSPLPFSEPERLVQVSHVGFDGQDELEVPMSQGLYLLYREQARSLGSMALYDGVVVNLVGEGEPQRVQGASVTPDFFDVLGASPAVGRGFTGEDGAVGAEPVVVLSHGLRWERFAADADVVGRTIDMDGVTRQVIGVMPERFAWPDEDARFWIPMIVDPVQAPLAAFPAEGVARLADAATVESAGRELSALLSRLEALRPGDVGAAYLSEVARLRAEVVGLKEAVVGDVSRTLWVLLGTVGFVLLIACANVANLLLVRAEGRQRELALRMALGADRWAVVRPFLVESLFLALVGGALGLLVASAAVDVAARLAPSDIPRMAEVGVDLRVLGFTGAVSVVAAGLFGLFPVFRYGRRELALHLKDGGRGGTGGRQRHRLRNGLVVAQVGLALVLLVGSGLMLRSFLALRSVDTGVDADGVLTVQLTVPAGEIPGAAETAAFFDELRRRLADQPGVEAVGTVSGSPLTGSGSRGGHQIEDHPRGPREMSPFAWFRHTDPGYFEAMGIPLLEGRALRPGDAADQSRSVVVSRSYAERWWPGRSPLGRRVRPLGQEDWWEIVGVAGDVRYRGLEEAAEEVVYYPTLTGPRESPIVTRSRNLVVRVASDAATFMPVLRREVWAVNPRIPLANPRTMESVREEATARTSFTVVLLGAASGIALLLGVVGVYGVVSYAVSQRTREIGVRMALGAPASSVRRLVVGQGLALAGAGVVLGLLAAGTLSSLMSSLLYGVSATDPLTYGAVAVTLTAVVALASWLPAFRAAGVDPSTVLRED